VSLQANDKIEFGKEGQVVFLFESAATTSVSGVLREAFGETVAPVEWKVGDTILGLYEVTGLLGQGGFGKVYKVHHKGWNMDLAVKSPLPKLFADEEAVANFIREAETWVNLDLHPNIVQCHYVRTIGGIPRIFAEYVPSGTLHHWIAQNKLTTLEEILDVAIQFAWGLHAAHEKGLVHQDVKPLNVLMTPDGVAKVSDFGLARSKPVVQEDLDTGEGNLVTMAGQFTIAYCSPEQVEAAKQQAAGVPIEARVKLNRSSDIWSWAVSVLQMFTGKVVWKHGLDALRVLRSHRSIFGPGFAVKVPKPLMKLLESCFSLSPEERPKDMLEIVGALVAIYQTECGEAYLREEPKSTEHLADGLNNRALSLLDLGRTEKAERLWEEALKADPQHLESIYNYGLHQWRTARTDDWRLVMRLHEADAGSASRQGSLLVAHIELESGDAEGAIRILEQLEEIDKQRAEVKELLILAQGKLLNSGRPIRRFKGHRKLISSVCLSVDERYAMSGSWDYTLRLWDISSGSCLRTYEGHTDCVKSVCLSHDGQYAFSGGDDNAIRLWNVADGRCLRILEEHDDWVNSVCLSSDSQYLVSGSQDQTVRLWDVADGRCLRIFNGHIGAVGSVCISADGQHVLSGSGWINGDRTLRLWELRTGRCVRVFEGHSDGITAVCLSSDGRYALSSSLDGTLRFWDIASGHCLRVFEGHTVPIMSVSMSGDLRRCLSANEDGTLQLWEISSGRCLRNFEGHTHSIYSVCLSADGRHALSGSQDRTLQLWDTANRTGYTAPWVLSRIADGTGLSEIASQFKTLVQTANQAFLKNNMPATVDTIRRARTLCGYEKAKAAWDLWSRMYTRLPRRELTDGWVQQVIDGHEDQVNAVCFSGDGSIALSAGGDPFRREDYTLRLWELRTGRCAQVFNGHSGSINSVCLSTDARCVLSGSLDGTLRLWDVASGNCLRIFQGHTKSVQSVCLSEDGRYALSGSYDMTLRLWETASGHCVRVFEGHSDAVHSVCLTADGRYVLSGSSDGMLRMWKLATGDCIRKFVGHTASVQSVCVSAEGQYAVSGCHDKDLRLWNIRDGCCIRVFQGHSGAVQSVCLSSDGRHVLSGSLDSTLRMWKVASGECVRLFEGHTTSVQSVCISRDGRNALSGSCDKTARLWALDWELDLRPEVDWDDGAEPYLQNFLVLRCPAGDDGLARIGRPQWNEEDFNRLLYTLGCAGYGWLRPVGVRRELEKMAASWPQ
jgi:WD40 repeat protein/serine/threonine protein kinase